LVDRAGERGSDAARQALDHLLRRYLPALRAHLVFGKRLSPADADDVLQDFVAGKILERDLIARADQRLGKFRTFLLTALDRFLWNQLRNRGARKRAADEAGALGDRDGQLSAGSGADVFDQAWAREVLRAAVERMRDACLVSDRADVWGLFECRVLGPALEGREPEDYATLVRRFGFQSPAQAANALVTAKRMYARMLRAVIGEYTSDAAEVETEIEDLYRALTGET
jgi:RNA polymerase sigma-70 factor (ECF subfamily)